MSISFRDVEEILRIIDEYPVAEIRFEHQDLKLYIRREPGSAITAARPASVQPSTESSVTPAVRNAPAEVETPSKPAAKKTLNGGADARHREGQVPVKAPVSGTFYSSPSPGAPPFVSVGQVVDEGSDLFIIEVMKLMNFVKSPIGGKIVSVEVENAEAVQQDQCTMWIQPARGQ
jgi:acetyl-CoA carboxylase biotin carboxyl carrier protein